MPPPHVVIWQIGMTKRKQVSLPWGSNVNDRMDSDPRVASETQV